VENEGAFQVELVHILDRKVKVIHEKDIGLVKVQWDYYGIEYETWENEEIMLDEYPQILFNIEENRS
jgi:hypothetical protein